MNHEDAERRIVASLISQLGQTLDTLHDTRTQLRIAKACAAASTMFALVVGCGWLIALGQRDRAIDELQRTRHESAPDVSCSNGSALGD